MGFEVSNDKFSEKICDAIYQGYAITPFLGSGCSAFSGIMMGQEFTDYLGYAVYISLSGHPEEPEVKWDISRNGWPERPNEEQISLARKWCAELFQKLAADFGMRATPGAENRIIEYVPSQAVSSPELLARLLTAPVVPAFLRTRDLLTEDQAIRTIQEHILGKHAANDRIISSSKSETSYAAICEKALRSLSDWRATLQFLASLRYTRSGRRVSIGDMDQSIIDRFNVHITKNKKPNLTHQMIAQLAMSARIRVILTTNFDRLIETAFENFGRQLTDIPVGIYGGLPHPDLVHGNDSLVKLHGDCHETRADFSLDDAPSTQDKDRFFHYVRGNYPGFSDLHQGERRYVPSHLLVLGYSGSDRRCNDMIKYVLDSDDHARVFWVCHSKRDLDRLEKTYQESDYRRSRIIATATERPDLLLYDLYQKLNLTLPSAGTSYHFPDRVIPARSPLKGDDESDAAIDNAKKVRDCLAEGGKSGSVVILHGESGVLPVIHQTFELLREDGKHRIWLELEDFCNSAAVGAEIWTGLSLRTGTLPLEHVKPLPVDITRDRGKEDTEDKRKRGAEARICAWRKFFTESREDLGISPKLWTIGLYGRNGAGGCAGWRGTHETWDTAEFLKLENLIEGLKEAGFNVLYAPYTEQRENRDNHHLKVLAGMGVTPPKARVAGDPLLHKSPWGTIQPHKTPLTNPHRKDENNIFTCTCTYRQPSKASFGHVLREISSSFMDMTTAEEKFGTLRHKQIVSRAEWLSGLRALYSATLFRQSRHFSAFLTEALYPCPNQFNLARDDNDESRLWKVRAWIGELHGLGMFYTKPGGFAWAYRDVRLGIRYLLDTLHHRSDNETKGHLIRLRNFSSRYHFHIGEWYAKAHRVTRHPLPMIEGLHHFYEAALKTELVGSDAGENEGWYDKSEKGRELRIVYTKRSLFFSSMTALLNLLRSGEASLRYWLSVPFRESMFGPEKQGKLISNLEEVVKKIFSGDPIPPPSMPGDEGALPAEPVTGEDGAKKTREHADSLIDDFRRELVHIHRRIDSDYRITDVAFQKSIPPDNSCDYHFYNEEIGKMITAWKVPTESSVLPHAKSDSKPHFVTQAGIFQIAGMVYRLACTARKPEESSCDDPMHSHEIRDLTVAIKRGFLFGRHANIANPHEINLFIQALIEWAFIFVRRGKRLFRARKILPDDSPTEDHYRDYLVASILCNMALDLSRILPPAYVEHAEREQIKAQCIYGLALGHLGRFREAYRRLGEARAICRSIKSDEGMVLLGIAELRRAEVLCLEARECGAVLHWYRSPKRTQVADAEDEQKARLGTPDPKDGDCSKLAEAFTKWYEFHGMDLEEGDRIAEPQSTTMAREILKRRMPSGRRGMAVLNQMVQAKISDAWRSLEESRRCFSGRTHSPRWWGKQYSMELRIFGEMGLAIRETQRAGLKLEWFRMLPYRNRRHLASYLHTLWRKGLAVAGTGEDNDRYSRLKITYIYFFSLGLAPGPEEAEPGTHGSNSHEDLRLTPEKKQEACDTILDFLEEEFPVKDFPGFKRVAELRAWTGTQKSYRKVARRISFKDLFPGIEENLNHQFYLVVVKEVLLARLLPVKRSH